MRSDENYSILSRIVQATKVDTIVHTFLIVDSTQMPGRLLHEINVIGTMNLFAAASSPASTVRNVLVKSSALVYGCSPQDPVWCREDYRRTAPVRSRVERSLVEVEGYVRDFAVDNPHVTVSLLRFSNVLGPDIVTPLSKALRLPLVPSVFGFDPRFQFVHEDDVVRSMLFVVGAGVPGIFNVAGDGLLPWSEVARICGKRTVAMPFVGAGLAAVRAAALRRRHPARAHRAPQVRAGHRQPPAQGGGVQVPASPRPARCRPTSRRCASTAPSVPDPEYQYQEAVENFFRHSPAVVRDRPVEPT